jgi:hypothetical protein
MCGPGARRTVGSDCQKELDCPDPFSVLSYGSFGVFRQRKGDGAYSRAGSMQKCRLWMNPRLEQYL